MQKCKEDAQRTSQFCEFLVELTSAALGGGKKSAEGSVGMDTGEGMEELTEEQIAMWKDVLGEQEFARMYPDYV